MQSKMVMVKVASRNFQYWIIVMHTFTSESSVFSVMNGGVLGALLMLFFVCNCSQFFELNITENEAE